ncbi:MAG: DUF362 domain-containing protein [Candidatus Glassbacteria bacterium]
MRDCFRNQITRREFLNRLGRYSSVLIGSHLIPISSLSTKAGPIVSIVTSKDHRKALRTAVEMLGSMRSFVSEGDRVLVKPNISWDRRPEQAANTNPVIVGEVVRMCLEAGAKTVKVLDRTCNNATRCYDRSGIAAAAKEAGADVSFVSENRFKKVPIPDGTALKSWPIYREALRADKIINVPILKHHSMAILTMGLKNMMGLLGGDRGTIHKGFTDKIVDINTVIKPSLNIIDATRVLFRNGPQGGSLDDVKTLDTIIAGSDVVAVDSVGASIMEIPLGEIPYLTRASERGLGETELEKITIQKEELG